MTPTDPSPSGRSPHLLLIPLAAFVAILPLLLKGPTCGHDFDFHLLSWLEAATQYRHGGYPHWAFTPAYGAGEPRFLFYPPLSWTLGALLTLLLPIQYVATAFTFVALTLSGFTAHHLARQYASAPAALLCATLYLANPYMLFTAYERSAFAELLAAAWLPLLFGAALSLNTTGYPSFTTASPRLSRAAFFRQHSPRILRIAIPIALLWLTNAPAAVMACYALAVLTATRLLLPASRAGGGQSSDTWTPTAPTRLSLTLTTLAGTLLGLLLPAFYLLPAAYERRYVQITLATITGMRPTDHFLFHRMPGLTPDDLFHNEVVRTASIVSLLLLAAILVALLSHFLQKRTAPTPRRDLSRVALILLPLTLLVAFLLTPPSLFLWNHTPQLAYLQFPWRLDALLAVILLLTAAMALRSFSPPAWLAPVLTAALVVPAYTVFHQPCDATDTPIARAALFHSPFGTEPTDEYTPITADNDALQHSIPWWFACLATHPDPNFPSSRMPLPGPSPIHIEWELPCRALVVLNRRLYPDWLVTVNGQPITAASPVRDDGLISFIQPRGHMSLHLRYIRTADQKLGLLISALALLLALAIGLRAPHPRAPGVDS